MSVAYIGNNSRTEKRGLGRSRLASGSVRHTWLGHHFQGQRSRSPGRFTHRQLQRSAWERIERAAATLPSAGAVVGSAARVAHTGREGRGHIVSPRAQLVYFCSFSWLIVFLSFIVPKRWNFAPILREASYHFDKTGSVISALTMNPCHLPTPKDTGGRTIQRSRKDLNV